MRASPSPKSVWGGVSKKIATPKKSTQNLHPLLAEPTFGGSCRAKVGSAVKFLLQSARFGGAAAAKLLATPHARRRRTMQHSSEHEPAV